MFIFVSPDVVVVVQYHKSPQQAISRDVYRHAFSEKPVADASALCKQPMPDGEPMVDVELYVARHPRTYYVCPRTRYAHALPARVVALGQDNEYLLPSQSHNTSMRCERHTYVYITGDSCRYH